MTLLLLAALAIMFASLAGVITANHQFKKFFTIHLSLFVSFAAGIFLIVAYSLAHEVLEHSGSLIETITYIGIGGGTMLILFILLPTFHHHHDEHSEAHTHSRIDIRRILIADGIHNVGDGILLASAFAVNPFIGLTAAGSIFVHEIVQEISEFFVLRQAGLSTSRALLLNFLISSTILIGAVGSWFLLEIFEALESPLLGFAAGVFLIVVFFDLIPHSVRTSHTRTHYLAHGLWFLIGAGIMYAIGMLFGH